MVTGSGVSFTKDRGCHICEHGGTRAAGDDINNGNTYCTCATDTFVSSNACEVCSTGSRNVVGDDSAGYDTRCDICDADYYVKTTFRANGKKYGSTACTMTDCVTKCRADESCAGYSDYSEYKVIMGNQYFVEVRDGKCTAIGYNTQSFLAFGGGTKTEPTEVVSSGCTD